MFLFFSNSLVNTCHIVQLRQNDLALKQYEIFMVLHRGYLSEIFDSEAERNVRYEELKNQLVCPPHIGIEPHNDLPECKL